jgi:hypothetical protein
VNATLNLMTALLLYLRHVCIVTDGLVYAQNLEALTDKDATALDAFPHLKAHQQMMCVQPTNRISTCLSIHMHTWMHAQA